MMAGLRRRATAGETIDIVPFEKGLAMGGVRLTVIPGLYAVVAEFIKNLLKVRNVAVTYVAFPGSRASAEEQQLLYETTRQRSVPTLFVDDERPCASPRVPRGLRPARDPVRALAAGAGLLRAGARPPPW